MLRLLVITVVLSACVADEVAQATASPEPVMFVNNRHNMDQHRLNLHREGEHQHEHNRHRNDRYLDDRHRDRHDDDGDWLRRRLSDDHLYERRDEIHDHDDPQGPVILRSIRPHETGYTPDIARQNKIIADVYSPDYAEPTWVLDYRYLKSGGRDYTRGPGGQILILPRGIHTNEPKEFKNYDELIEHLRLKNLAERRKPQYFMPLGEGSRQDDHHDDHRAPLEQNQRDWWRGRN